MFLSFPQVKPIGSGVWIAPLSPSDARRFGQNPTSKGGRSIIGMEAPEFKDDEEVLTANLDKIFTLNVGDLEEVVFIDLRSDEVAPNLLSNIEDSSVSVADEKFVAACRHYLSDDVTGIIVQILGKVRKRYDDTLVEGNGRKWTTKPLNFLAITIQNRNNQFLISVKANLSHFSFKHIQPKRSRPPYCEFHLNSPSQIDEAIQLILKSAQYQSI